MEAEVLASTEFRRLQREQHVHDMRNHFDIAALHKVDRMKHYGLHYAKYVGRLARGLDEPKSARETLVDTLLVNLSAANTLHQDLAADTAGFETFGSQVDPLRLLADASGRFADACEKIDHLEEFVSQARVANRDIANWVIWMARQEEFDLNSAVVERRHQLAKRHFYIVD